MYLIYGEANCNAREARGFVLSVFGINGSALGPKRLISDQEFICKGFFTAKFSITC